MGTDNLCVPEAVSVLAALRPAVWAEVGYHAADGRPDAVPLVPLCVHGSPLFALPYAARELAEALAASPTVSVAVTDHRLAFRGWRAVSIAARLRLQRDIDGTLFRVDLLDDELRKHPPSRLFADSLVQRRENWWFLPRLLLTVEQVEAVQDATPRGGGDDGVLFWEQGGVMRAATVAVDDWSAERVSMTPLGEGVGEASGAACLLRHDYSLDLERRVVLRLRGRADGTRLTVEQREGELALPPPPSLWARWKSARALERDCRRELAHDEAIRHV
jgi:hypothetical protein